MRIMHASGMSVAEIGRVEGITRGRVDFILRRTPSYPERRVYYALRALTRDPVD